MIYVKMLLLSEQWNLWLWELSLNLQDADFAEVQVKKSEMSVKKGKRYFHSLFVYVGAGSRMHVLNVCWIKVLDCELVGSERVFKLYWEGFIPYFE